MENLQNSFIGLANFHVFTPGSDFFLERVQSRSLCWCCSGSGSIKVGSLSYHLNPGDFIFTTWNNAMEYHPSSSDPMVVGSIHLIPELRGDAPIVYEIFEKPHPELPEYQRRFDVDMPGFEETVSGKIPDNSRLFYLVNYIIRAYQDYPSREELRDMAIMLMREITHICYPVKEATTPLPVILQDMLNYIESHVERPLTIADLMKRSHSSRPTVFRYFRLYLHQTPNSWIMQQKMKHAARLLLTSTLSISEIAFRIAIKDRHYFSKLIHEHLGMTASEYRKAYSVNMLF